MHHFITRTQTTPPPIPIFWYGVRAFEYHAFYPRCSYLDKISVGFNDSFFSLSTL